MCIRIMFHLSSLSPVVVSITTHLVSSAGSISMELQWASTGLIRREKKLKRIGFLDRVGTFLLGLVVFLFWGGESVGGLFDIFFWFGIT